MLINSGIRLRRCIIDLDIRTERHIQKFCDFLYSIRIPNPNIIVLANPVEFILSVTVDFRCLRQTDLFTVHIDLQCIPQFREFSQLQHRRFALRGRCYHNAVPIMYLGIHIRLVSVDPDDCCLSLFAPHHTGLTIDSKQKGFPFSGEQLVIGELHLHSGICHG